MEGDKHLLPNYQLTSFQIDYGVGKIAKSCNFDQEEAVCFTTSQKVQK